MSASSRSYSGRSDRSPPYSHHHLTPPTSSRPSPTNASFPDRYSGPSRREEHRLPIHTGPPADRRSTHLATPGWSDRPPLSNMSPGASYAAPHPAPPYGTGAPGPRPREDGHRPGLPPPSPHQGYARDQGRESYPYSRPDEYDRSPWHDPPRQAYSHYSPSRPYDHHMPPPGPHGYASYPPGEAFNPHYSQLGPVGYESSVDGSRKRRGNLPRWITDLLKAWFLEHIAHPYPSEQEKNDLCAKTGCSMTQVSHTPSIPGAD